MNERLRFLNLTCKGPFGLFGIRVEGVLRRRVCMARLTTIHSFSMESRTKSAVNGRFLSQCQWKTGRNPTKGRTLAQCGVSRPSPMPPFPNGNSARRYGRTCSCNHTQSAEKVLNEEIRKCLWTYDGVEHRRPELLGAPAAITINLSEKLSLLQYAI